MKKSPKRIGWPDQNGYFASTKRPGPLDCKVGDQVSYTVYFLRQIAEGPTDPLCRRYGTVVELNPVPAIPHFVKVRWDDADKPELVSSHSLAKPGPNLRYCAG